MKNTIIILLFSFFMLPGKPKAQVLEDLKAPAMPAATIIGTQINEINTPKSLRALEAAVLNNYIDPSGNVLIPNNYALEITPFMLSKRTNFDYMRYLDDSIKQNLWRNLSFSIASTNNFIIGDTAKSNALGFGGRTIILNGKVNPMLKKSYQNKLNEYKDLMDAQTRIRTMIGVHNREAPEYNVDSLQVFLIGSMPQYKSIIVTLFENVSGETPKNKIRDVCEELMQPLLENTLNEFRMLLDASKTERYGLRWEIDGAFSLCFPGNDFNNSISPKYGIWSNISYHPLKKRSAPGEAARIPGDFEFIGLVRWINNNDDFISLYNSVDSIRYSSGNVFDFGARAVFDLKKFSAEFEFIYRLNQNTEYVTVNENEYSRSVNDDTFKYVLNLNYNITDNIILSYNLGKNYDMAKNANGNLLSGFTVSFGFGGVKKEELVEAVKNSN